MRRTTTTLLMAAAALLVAATPANAAPANAAPAKESAQACGTVRLTSDLPAPPAGKSVRQSVTIGANCQVVKGPVEFVPAVTAKLASTKAYHTASEMYDCCNILMTALYTDSTATTSGGQVTASSTAISTHNNREPWDAGWSVAGTSGTGGCSAACAAATYTEHAEFSYQGIFDPTGVYYYNTHDSAVVLNGDGTATCTQSVTLKHTFVGWNWQHSCS